MEKEILPIWNKIKNEIKNNYFNLTIYYFSVYAISSIVVIYGLYYLIYGSLDFDNIKSNMLISLTTIVLTIATMVKKLTDKV